ncbi:MAG: hypothetical protein H6510_11520 [Acidobacteria bacterium]|nr:hypothetical protein [Acidobacteriota bacterium]MCB9398434.1 hypothetical protein [Acidobacteriota bacterium]
MKQRFEYGNEQYEVKLLSRQPLVLSLSGEDGAEHRLEPQISADRIRIGDQTLPLRVSKSGDQIWVSIGAETFMLRKAKGARSQHQKDQAGFTAPMPGKVVKQLVQPGEQVEAGAVLLILEAMKMEHRVEAPTAGQVTVFHCKPGDLVEMGFQLLEFQVNET